MRLWDAASGHPVGRPLIGHTNQVDSVAFSPDGTRIASGSGDTTLRLWDAHNGLPVGPPMTAHLDTAFGVAFSPDGKRIITGSADSTLRLWPAYADVATLCAKHTTNIGHPVAGLAVARHRLHPSLSRSPGRGGRRPLTATMIQL